MNRKMNSILKTEDKDYVIASDTDSIYLHMGPLVDIAYKGREKTTEGVVAFLNKVCEKQLGFILRVLTKNWRTTLTPTIKK